MSLCGFVSCKRVCVCLIVGSCVRVCIHAFFLFPPSLVCFRRAVEILSKPNYRSADSVTMHCRQTGKKNLSNFELELKKKRVFMLYSQCSHIWAGVIRGYREEESEPRCSDKKPKKKKKNT